MIDVSDLNSIQNTVADITKQEADFSLLVNNAGISGDMGRAAWKFEAQELIETYMVDNIGPYELTKGLLPVLR